MEKKYLNVDSDVDIVDTHAAIWAEEHEVGVDRVDNMTEAIKKLLENDKYICVAINSDTVDFMPLLRTMRNTVPFMPILIVTGDFTTEKEIAALKNGADLYTRWHNTPNGNIDSVLAHIERITERRSSPQKVMIYKNLLVAPENYQVFVKNTEINLTKKEFDILYYFMENHDILLPYNKILNHIWGAENATTEVLWAHIKNIRKKLAEVSSYYENVVENVHGIGYKFIV